MHTKPRRTRTAFRTQDTLLNGHAMQCKDDLKRVSVALSMTQSH